MTVVGTGGGGGDNDGCSGRGWWWWYQLIGQLINAFRRLIGGGFCLFVSHCSSIGREEGGLGKRGGGKYLGQIDEHSV